VVPQVRVSSLGNAAHILIRLQQKVNRPNVRAHPVATGDNEFHIKPLPEPRGGTWTNGSRTCFCSRAEPMRRSWNLPIRYRRSVIRCWRS
jgi:hypothetical protein